MQRSIVSFNSSDGNDSENIFCSDDNGENKEDDFDRNLGYEFEQFKRSRDDFQFIFEIDDDLKPTKAHIVLFNPGTDREGVHTIEFPKGSGNNLILAFESRIECEQFSDLLKDQNFFDPSVSTMSDLFSNRLPFLHLINHLSYNIATRDGFRISRRVLSSDWSKSASYPKRYAYCTTSRNNG
jgi:hypothetical protein